jgi:diaminohydroxyphosphoribosylaminopyrimidine deaminase/5-amino-6-(5-phosphoribosylamino)uracil reductase
VAASVSRLEQLLKVTSEISVNSGRKTDREWMRLALRLARRGYGHTSPNPMVGAVLVKTGRIIGQGWHRLAGEPHAEIESLRDAELKGHSPEGATLYVTLEPCCTQGCTPPCTEAIKAAGVKRVVVGATDPNPNHRGRAFRILRRAGINVASSVLADECTRLNEAFNHWIGHRTPFVTVKAAMTLDGKIATASGESKWITGEQARAHAMKLRAGADAILVGVNTVLADDPSLTVRSQKPGVRSQNERHPLRRIVLDSKARTPLTAKVVTDEFASLTTIVVTKAAPANRVAALAKKVRVWVAPAAKAGRAVLSPPRRGADTAPYHGRVDLRWVLRKLGKEDITHLLVEGGGEVNASFLLGGLAHRVTFFYAPKILGGRDARKAVGGEGVERLEEVIRLRDVEWRRLGPDLFMTARVA